MADITPRRNGELLRELFEILGNHPDGLQARDALVELEKKAPPTDFEQGQFGSGGRRYEKIVRWATVDCVKAGWLVKSRGRWSITDEGRKAYREFGDPETFYKRANALYKQWRKATPKKSEDVDPGEGEPEGKDASITFEQADEQAWSEIERHLTEMPPYDFQDLVADLLKGMGYHVGWTAPPGKDGGIDIVAFNDPLGTRPPRIKVQVKRQQQRIPVDGVRSFMAVLAAEDVGLFVNTGGFTKDAEDEARSQQVRRITLIDLEKLVDLWTQHYSKLEQSAKRRMPLEPIWFLAPEA